MFSQPRCCCAQQEVCAYLWSPFAELDEGFPNELFVMLRVWMAFEARWIESIHPQREHSMYDGIWGAITV